MLWLKLLTSFLCVYIAYNGLVLLGSVVRYVFNDIANRTQHRNIFIPATALLILTLVIFLVDYPLVMMLDGAMPVNPVIVGAEIVAALIIRHEQITKIL